MDYNVFCKIIAENLSTIRTIQANDRLASDLGLCSFDLMVLLFNLEQTIGHQIDASSMKKDITVKELFDLISEKR